MIWIETPSNPCFHIVDMEAVSTIARENKIILVVDNSFLTPYFMVKLYNLLFLSMLKQKFNYF